MSDITYKELDELTKRNAIAIAEEREAIRDLRRNHEEFIEEQRFFHNMVSDRFIEVDRRFDEVARRFTEVDQRFNENDRKFDRIFNILDAHTGKLDTLNIEMKSISIGLEDQDTRIALLEEQSATE